MTKPDTEPTGKPALRQVNLPGETIADIDAIGGNLSAAIEQATGVPVELSRPQIIASIAKKVLAEQSEIEDADDDGSDPDPLAA